ncbi:DEAD/DEAH box helicase family protein [Candidatus Nanohalobium constans]|uniref:Type I restriction endonuclease subunit R n=1 Tax=Candidatus Nanohalobium constans TaxID=2565781 RepID=A0A5Q0UGU3_9ARCH|nr:DEAD/DEAH box helicase family protein [Candidatus Nanohalobium constans]QGA80872.1 type I restriction endonuclease subunit R [Candidatus Nanohalobium constans]
MSKELTEEKFEDIIVEELVSKDTEWKEGEVEPLYTGFNPGNYRKRENRHFDTEYCLIPEDVLEFVKDTQPEEWQKLENFEGDNAEEKFLKTLDRQLKRKGAIEVLRNGLRMSGARFEQLAYFKPATDRNKEAVENYEKNIFSVIRQLRYKGSKESVDLAVFLNGIPIFTSELKVDFNQNVNKAKRQYKEDRDPRDKLFSPGRCLAHFAVSPEEVYMTTELAGQDTTFLPFNKGNDHGAGNPSNPSGYRTSYFWKYLLSKDSVLNIVQNFITEFKERDDQGDLTEEEILVFPRYHQLQAVRKCVDDVEKNGAGERYLIQHSAGSGKTFTISWLAHQLAEIHNDENEPVYDSVIVISDRRVLDDQLQHHLKQFSQVEGVVANVEESSQQLKNALESGEKIIVSTIHKFDYIVEEMEDLSDRNFAVLIDEAHSSQTGELKDSQTKTLADIDDEEGEEVTPQDRLNQDMESRGALSNVSSFAFTATPKEKTLEMFGEPKEDEGYEPFSLYSMRQAIEEGFILDVLQNYTTYDDYFNLLKTIENNPEFEESKTKRLLKSFVDSHDLVISKKTEIIVEHFVEEVMHKIDGKAKAMLVTGSREQVIKYKEAFDEYLDENNYNFKALAAFSEFEYNGEKVSEKDVNEDLDTKIEDKFEEDDARTIIVANKFQTGFDQPLLHTMYVDKKLGGVRAVQTLSRLNRTHPDKEDTMVVDFKNDPEDIQKAFERFYTKTKVKQGTNPQLVYDLEEELKEFKLFKESEVEDFAELWYSKETRQDELTAVLDPVKDRYENTDEEKQEDFRKKLKDFIQLYSFLIKVVNFRDEELHKLYQFSRVLYRKLPVETGDMPNEVKQFVDLDQYHIKEVSNEEDRSLEQSGGELGPTHKMKDGKKVSEEKKSPLENIVEMLNKQFGYEVDEQDKNFIKHLKNRLQENQALKETVEKNNKEKAQMKFKNVTRKEMLDMIDQNTEFFNKATNDNQFAEVFQSWLYNQFINSSKKDSRDMVEEGRDKNVEFEERMLPDKESDAQAKERIAKHVCAFANSAGGHLILGVDKEGQVTGLEKDFKAVQKGQDGFQDQLHEALSQNLGETFASQKIQVRFDTLGDKSICVIGVEPSDEPIYVATDDFYVREDSRTDQLSKRDTEKYIKKHFRDE